MNDRKNDIINKIRQEDNPLSEIIVFTEDGTQINNFEGKLKTIIGASGRIQLEELARELLMKTYLKNEQSFYSAETLHGSYRSDLIAKIEKDISNIIEVKESDDLDKSKILKLVADSFSQIKLFYAKDLNKDCLASVVVINMQKIANNPDLISKYHNLSPDKKKDIAEIFNKYGIYIETRRFDVMNQKFSDKSQSNIAIHGDFKIKTNSQFLKGKTTKIYCEIANALKLPTTSTNSYGFKNVRDIRDPNISKDKADIVLDILKTSQEAFEKKDPTIITTAGKDKDFLISEDESISYMTDYDDYTHLTICTLNGAIIDGQNSIDGFRWIIDTLEKALKNKNIENKGLIGFEKNIYSHFSDYNLDKIEKYLLFLKKAELGINLEETKDIDSAKKRAISKNNTMQVSKADIAISGIQIPIQMLATDLLDGYDINLNFPKKEMYCVSQKIKEKTIDIEILAKYFNVALEFIKKNRIESLTLFKFAQSLSGSTKPEILKNFIDQYVSKSKGGSEESKEINNKIDILKTKEQEILDYVEPTSKLISIAKVSGLDISEMEQYLDEKNNELIYIREEISRLFDKADSLTDLLYTIRNKKELVSLINRIILIEKKVFEQYEKIKNEESFKILKIFITNKEKMAHYIFVMSLIKQPDINVDFKVNEIKDLFFNLVNNIKNIYQKYSVDMTTLRNASDDNTLCLKKDGIESTTLREPRNEFFRINDQ